ncbi:MAG: succinate dehydrogenase/fumarate reductase iron-sulfur subunit [Methanobrevibacter sp.]|jgi:fumarate reductase (CoM/CoB) subunit B|nr:succinate dehydrogenase/fumarate reductase iron-sulfur subunit [Candidatus Methanoflexus mossambicus]
MVEIEVLRFDNKKNKKPCFEKFEVEKKPKMKILDALNYITDELNTDLSFRSSCRAGQCGSCALKVNGNVILACKGEIQDGDVIEPLDFPVIKDLIVDKSSIDEKVKIMRLFLEKSDNVNEVDNYGFNPVCACSLIPASECQDTKTVRSCIECYSCLSACPVIKKSTEFVGPYFMRYLAKFDFDPRDIDNRTKESIDYGLYCCTSCGQCKEVCPKEINSFGDAIEKLRTLAYEKHLGPLQAHIDLAKKVVKTGRSVDKLNKGFIEEYNASTKVLNNQVNNQVNNQNKIKPKIAIFTGCMVDYRLQNLGFALMDVLKINGFECDVPQEQVCCGSPLLRTGQRNLVDNLVLKNKEVFATYDLILTLCAGCGATLKNDYPDFGVKLNVKDISEFIYDKVNTEDMNELKLNVTYHDPCHLSRSQGIRQEPRILLNKIKGVDFIEMEKPNQCCGSGGGVRAGKPEIAASLVKDKVKMIKDIDVDAVISICPFCQFHIQDALDKKGLNGIEVMNILELLKKSYSN